MKRLYLLRHAKSSWDEPDMDDHERPLASRGQRAGATMAKYMAERKDGPPAVDLILCSTARRARETLDAVAGAWKILPPVEYERGLYLCGEQALFDRLRALPDQVGAVMLVGHNPDFAHLALRLSATGDMVDMHALEEKFPTGTLVAINLPLDRWGDLAWRSGELVEFVTPRSLEMGA